MRSKIFIYDFFISIGVSQKKSVTYISFKKKSRFGGRDLRSLFYFSFHIIAGLKFKFPFTQQ